MAIAKEEDKKAVKDSKKVPKAEVKKPDKKAAEEPVETPKSEKIEAAAKAGKRSAKAVAETEEKEAKELKKESKDTAVEPKKARKIQKVRSKLERRSKKYRESAKLIDQTKTYGLKEAVELALKTSTVKFDATVEMHIRLNVDPKQADQNIRDSIVLPAGTGKSSKVAVFADDELEAAAKKAGAQLTGSQEITEQLDKGQIDFDVLICVPELMVKLSKYARILGPKGLMPSPKTGTVTKNVAKAVKEALAGKIDYRVDSTGIIHSGIGKVSFGPDKIYQNAQVLLDSVKSKKPNSIKSAYIRSIAATTTMGPSVKIKTED